MMRRDGLSGLNFSRVRLMSDHRGTECYIRIIITDILILRQQTLYFILLRANRTRQDGNIQLLLVFSPFDQRQFLFHRQKLYLDPFTKYLKEKKHCHSICGYIIIPFSFPSSKLSLLSSFLSITSIRDVDHDATRYVFAVCLRLSYSQLQTEYINILQNQINIPFSHY